MTYISLPKRYVKRGLKDRLISSRSLIPLFSKIGSNPGYREYRNVKIIIELSANIAIIQVLFHLQIRIFRQKNEGG